MSERRRRKYMVCLGCGHPTYKVVLADGEVVRVSYSLRGDPNEAGKIVCPSPAAPPRKDRRSSQG